MNSQLLADKDLRNFGFIISVGVLVFSYLILPFIFGVGVVLWPLLMVVALVVWAFFAPSSLKLIYIPWMRFGHILGLVNTSIILSIIFFIIITPAGWLLRLTGVVTKDTNTDVSSYKKARCSRDKQHLEKPY